MQLKKLYEWMKANKEMILVAIIFVVLFCVMVFLSKIER